MTDCKFKLNIPKSITLSYISDFNCEDLPKTHDANDILGLGVEQADSDIEENENEIQADYLTSLNLPQKQVGDSKKILNSHSLCMSQSRAKEELIPGNFTDVTNQRLSDINSLLLQKSNTDDKKLKKKYATRLMRKIKELRIVKKSFSFNLSIGQQNVYDFQTSDITSLNNQLYLKHDTFIKRYILDVDYFRMQEIAETDQFSYFAINYIDDDNLVISNNNKELLIYNLSKSQSTKYMKLISGIGKCTTVQLQDSVNLIKNKDENQLLMSSVNGLINTYDKRFSSVTGQWLDYRGESNQSVKFLDTKGHQNLISYQNDWVIFDQRKPSKILVKQNQDNLQKAIFLTQEKQIAYFGQNSRELKIFNQHQNKLHMTQIQEYNMNDLLINDLTNELVILQNDQIDKNKWISQINIMDNRNLKLNFKDWIQMTLAYFPITYLLQDKTKEMIYGINPQFIKIWKFFDQEEMQQIKNDLLLL